MEKFMHCKAIRITQQYSVLYTSHT